MTDASENITDGPDGPQDARPVSGLRDQFPGHFPPGYDDLREFFTGGLVVLDTNALFAAYRLHPHARAEFIAVLRALDGRLWIPHQVGKEFHERRPGVIRDCYYAADALKRAIFNKLSGVWKDIDNFGKRAGLSDEQTEVLIEILNDALKELQERAAEFNGFAIMPGTPPDADPVYQELEAILDGKVGLAPADPQAMQAEGMRRVAHRIPPGYADGAKKGSRPTGDYMLWIQTIEKARERKAPVLLVTNDEKEDWVYKDPARDFANPRNELVLEMREETGQRFHLLTIPEFLVQSREFLAATVSDSTVEQAAADSYLDDDRDQDGDDLKRNPSLLEAVIVAIVGYYTYKHGTADSMANFMKTLNSHYSLPRMNEELRSSGAFATELKQHPRLPYELRRLAYHLPTAEPTAGESEEL